MSEFLSNEARIEELEKTVRMSLQMQKMFTVHLRDKSLLNAHLTKFIFELKDDNLLLLGFLASTPLIADENVRQIFLKHISKLETQSDQLTALLDGQIKKMESDPPPPSPI